MMSDSKTLVVIGGSSGIGLRTAQVAAAQGARSSSAAATAGAWTRP